MHLSAAIPVGLSTGNPRALILHTKCWKGACCMPDYEAKFTDVKQAR